jgi:hypothetical protein
MIPLRLPGSHPNSAVIQKWASDKEQIITTHGSDIKQLQGIIKTILSNQPDLGKPKQ